MRKTPRLHLRETRNNTLGIIQKKTIQVRSEGERSKKNLQQLATSEGEKLRATEKITNDWYHQPREKRRLGYNNRESKTNKEVKKIHKRAECKVGQAERRGNPM